MNTQNRLNRLNRVLKTFCVNMESLCVTMEALRSIPSDAAADLFASHRLFPMTAEMESELKRKVELQVQELSNLVDKLEEALRDHVS